ncbi:MAG: CBS domain-containing protein [Nitrososphaeria archaeon]
MNRKVITVPYDADISEFLKIACKYGYQIYPVLKEGQLVGIVDSKNLIDIMLGLSKARKVSDIIEKRVTVVYPDQTLTEAMRAIYTNKARKLLVVDRSKPDRLVGIINKTDIVMTYTLEKIE